MSNAVAHCLLSDARELPEQQSLTSFPPSLYMEHDVL